MVHSVLINLQEYDGLIKSIVKEFNYYSYIYPDLVQEGYLALINSHKTWNGTTKFSGYAYKHIWWRVYQYCMKEKRHHQKIAPHSVPATKICLDDLDDSEKEILFYKISYNYTFKEISQKFNISKSSLHRRYKNILQKLKNE